MRLPAEKLAQLKAILRKWVCLLSCHKHELHVLVGLLHDASIVITPGHTFLRRLIDLITSAHHRPSSGFIQLNLDAQSDIHWWHTFIDDWNCLSTMQHSRRQHPDIIFTSDASGSWGCGAYILWGPLATVPLVISNKRLQHHSERALPHCACRGKEWAYKSVLCRCNNEAVVSIINTGTSRDPIAMGLMQLPVFHCGKV